MLETITFAPKFIIYERKDTIHYPISSVPSMASDRVFKTKIIWKNYLQLVQNGLNGMSL